ncbi:MAG: DUF6265 family protein [Casimicrobiaceae bacterium]
MDTKTMHARTPIVLAILAVCCAFDPALAQTPPAQSSAVTVPPAVPVPPAAPPQALPAAGAMAPAGASHAPMAAATNTIADLDWLHGCWAGEVNQRKFTEQWTAPAAGMMLGLGHTVMNGKTQSFEFMRIETRDDGKLAYIAKPGDKAEEGYVYQGIQDDRGMSGFVFSNPARDFPSQIVYTRGLGGELYAYVKGKINGVDRQVIYPFHRVDCASGKSL